MNTSDLELALRVKSDMAQARADLRGLGTDIKGVEQAAGGARAQANAYTDQMSQLQRASVGAAQQSKSLADALALMNKIDPVGNKLDRLDALESELNKLHKAGTIGADDFTHLGAILESQRNKLTGVAGDAEKAATGMAHFTLNNSVARLEIGRMVKDLATGQYSRLGQSTLTLANYTGVMSAAFSATGLVVTGFVAILGTLLAAFIAGEKESDAFNRSLIATGNAATSTAGQMVDLVNRVGQATGSYGNAQDALLALSNTGRYSQTQLEQLTQTAAEFATMTGGKVADGVKFVDQVMSGNIGTLMKLDEQYHFLSASQFDQIQQLRDQGKEEQATQIAQSAAAQAVHQRALDVKESVGIMAAAWDGLKEHISAVWEEMKRPFEAQSIAQLRASAIAELQNAQGTHLDRAGNLVQNASPEAVAALQAKVRDLTTQLVQQGITQTAAEVEQNAETKAKAAAQYLEQFKTPLQELNAAEQKAAKNLDDFLLGKHSPEAIEQAYGEFHRAIDGAVSKYQSSTKQKGALGIDHAQLAADVAAVQNSLKLIQDAYTNADKTLEAQHKAGLVSDQAYYQGLREDATKWELDQVAMLEQEKAAAQSHIKTQADRIKADQKVAEIDTEITKVHQDAAAKREQVDADEKAAIQRSKDEWESLRRSMENPIDAKVDAAIAKIEKLNEALAGGGGDPSQYNQLVTSVAQNSVTKAPHYQGLDAVVGGPFGELNKINDHMAELNAWHTQALAANQKFRQKDTANEIAYQAGLANIEKQYSDEKQNIEQARQQAQLTATANLFGQLASLSTSHNKKMAAIGKAAAIAQTIINTYQSATEAYKSLAGIPYIGPALGIAAAAAAIAAGLANVQAIRSQNVAFAGGGLVSGPGTGTSDSIYARLSNQEYVHTAATTAYYGVDFMDRLNRRELPRYADGGLVTSSGGTVARTGIVGGSGAPVEVVVNITNQGEPVSAKQTSSHRDQNRVIVDMVIATAANDMASGGRLAKATEQRYGLQRRGIPMGG